MDGVVRYLHGFHDEGGEGLHGSHPGWTLITEEIGLDVNAKGKDYSHIASKGIGVLIRLNYSHTGEGTIPLPEHYDDFALACQSFVGSCKGVYGWIIGNEPNLKGERPKDAADRRVVIQPEQYADCFLSCRDAIYSFDANALVMPAAMAPYNAEPMDWLEYARRVLTRIAMNGGCRGLTCHAYTRGMSPGNVRSDARMGSPLLGQYSGFYTFRDFIERAVPVNLIDRPIWITEFDAYGDWLDQNTGVLHAAYETVNDWNHSVRPDGRLQPQIVGLICFRWKWGINDVDWGMGNKPQLLAEFAQVAQRGFLPPATPPTPVPVDANTIHLPEIMNGNPPMPTPPAVTRNISQDFLVRTQSGVDYLNPEPGSTVFYLIEADFSENAAREWGPDHHILVEVLDEQGNRIQGQEVTFIPGNEPPVVKKIDKGSGTPYGVDYDLYAAGYGYKCYVGRDIQKSDLAEGMGLGKIATPRQGDHVSYFLKFQRRVAAPTSAPSQPTDQPAPSSILPTLIHPIPNPIHRIVSQKFGDRPEVYDDFTFDGVPLKGHEGIDFAAPLGSPVRAVDAGRAIEVGSMGDKGYGLYVKLLHAWGETVYAHLSEQKVKQGEFVNAGQVIGSVGYTGNVEPKSPLGAHLHLGLRRNPYNRQDGWGGYSDPAPYLAGALSQPPPPAQNALSKIEIVKIIRDAAGEFDVSYALLLSLIHAESSLDPGSTNLGSGAKGLGQLRPLTWEDWAPKVGAKDILDARDNARVTARYLLWCLQSTYNARQALWAYAWGWGYVQEHLQGKRALPDEVSQYASKVLHGKEVIEFAALI